MEDFLLVESTSDRDASARCTGPFIESPLGLCRGDKILQVTPMYSTHNEDDGTLEDEIGKVWADCVVLTIPSPGKAGWNKCQITWEFKDGFMGGDAFEIEEQGRYPYGSPERTAAFENAMVGGTGRYTKASGVCKQKRMGDNNGNFFGSIYSVDMDF